MDLALLSAAPLCLAVRFDATDRCFNGHFPGNPVVPGSLIAGLCLWSIGTHLGVTEPLTITRFAFERFATPGDYELRIDNTGRHFACTLSAGGHTFARGRITSCA